MAVLINPGRTFQPGKTPSSSFYKTGKAGLDGCEAWAGKGGGMEMGWILERVEFCEGWELSKNGMS